MGKYLDLAKEAEKEALFEKSRRDVAPQPPYEINEFNEISPTDEGPQSVQHPPCTKYEISPTGTTYDQSPSPVVEDLPFNEQTMAAIRAGYPVRVWVGAVDEYAWWVRGEPERRKLLGVKEVVYTLGELALLAGMGEHDIRAIHAIKRTMGGGVVVKKVDQGNGIGVRRPDGGWPYRIPGERDS